MKKILTLEKKFEKLKEDFNKAHCWIARHIKNEELPLAINLDLCPEAMTIIHERLKHG